MAAVLDDGDLRVGSSNILHFFYTIKMMIIGL